MHVFGKKKCTHIYTHVCMTVNKEEGHEFERDLRRIYEWVWREERGNDVIIILSQKRKT